MLREEQVPLFMKVMAVATQGLQLTMSKFLFPLDGFKNWVNCIIICFGSYEL